MFFPRLVKIFSILARDSIVMFNQFTGRWGFNFRLLLRHNNEYHQKCFQMRFPIPPGKRKEVLTQIIHVLKPNSSLAIQFGHFNWLTITIQQPTLDKSKHLFSWNSIFFVKLNRPSHLLATLWHLLLAILNDLFFQFTRLVPIYFPRYIFMLEAFQFKNHIIFFFFFTFILDAVGQVEGMRTCNEYSAWRTAQNEQDRLPWQIFNSMKLSNEVQVIHILLRILTWSLSFDSPEFLEHRNCIIQDYGLC